MKRKFVQIDSVLIYTGSGASALMLHAVADDGTAWCQTSGKYSSGWMQIDTLPDAPDLPLDVPDPRPGFLNKESALHPK